MKKDEPSRKILAAGAAAIAVLVLLAYWPAAGNGWIWDDDDYVTENPVLEAPDGLKRIWSGIEIGRDPFFVKCDTPQYYPLVFSTFYIENALFGKDPAAFHWTNILLHALDAVLVFFLLRRLGLSLTVAWLAAALFGVHPVTVESVAWVSERKNVLSAFFYLSAFLAYLRFSDTGRRRFYGAALALFACALLSKSVTATLPLALILAEWLRRRKTGFRLLARTAPFIVIGAASGLFTSLVERFHVGAEGAAWDFSFVERCLIATRALCFYAFKLIVPVDLTFIYPRWRVDASAAWQYLFPAAVIAAFLAAFLLRRRVGRLPLFGLAFFAVSLLPALGFVDFYPQIYSFVADHFQYLGSLGVLVLAAAAIVWLANRLPTADGRLAAWGAASCLLLLTLCWLTQKQTGIYKDQETLWKDTISKNDEDFIGHNNLGLLYLKKRRFAEAEQLFLAAVGNNPGWERAWINLAGIYLGRGKVKQAEPVARKVLALKPGWGEAHNTMGMVLRRLGRCDEAEREFREAIRLAPLGVKPMGNLAAMAEEEGRLDTAEEEYRRIARIKPDWVTPWKKLAGVLVKRGKVEEAAACLRKVLAKAPEDVEALEGLARLLATCRRDEVRDGNGAVRLALAACRLTGFRKARALSTLAAAYAEAGDFAKAVEWQRRLARGAPPGLKAREEEILALYEAGKPLRE